jgi:hypothetical protein
MATRTIVSGWLYSPVIDLRGKLVLAYLDARLVGSGHVSIMRPDIQSAGLGDGQSGFYFPVTLNADDDPRCIAVRLEASDLSLFHPQAAIAVRSSDDNVRRIA